MEIKYGVRYKNRTSQYLLPCLLEGHGKVFSMKIAEMFILGCGLGDGAIIENIDFIFLKEKPIYILIDRVSVKRKSEDFIYWMKYQPYYLKDYPMDLVGRAHMIIIDMPKIFYNAYDKFSEGKYSEMFTPEQIDKMFIKDSKEYKVLTKNRALLPEFANRIRDIFEIKNLKENDIVNSELEFPYTVNKEEEFFNLELPH